MNARSPYKPVGLLLGIALVTTPVAAAMPSRPVTVTAESRPLKNVLEDIAGQAGMRVRVSPHVTTPINGAWTGPADRLFQQFVRTMNLVVSEEGGVYSVYAAEEVRSDDFASAVPAAVVQEVKGLTNSYNRVSAGHGLVHATGTPAFLASVERVAARIKAPLAAASVAVARGEAPLQPAPPANAPIATPAYAMAASTGFQPALAAQPVAYAPPGYEIVRSAPRGGYEMRAYRLRYEQADDRVVREGRYERSEPGVASRVRAGMGLGTLTTTRREIRQAYVDARPNFPNEGSTVNVYQQPNEAARTTVDTLAVDGPTVIADSARNMVIIRDLPSRMPQYEALINQFDVPRRQIEVEIAIIDVSVDKAHEYGIDFGLKISSLVALFGGLGPTGAMVGGGFVTNNGDVFAGRINGLERRGIVRVTNRFTMLIKENATESYTNMAEVPYEVEGKNGYLVPLEAGTRITATPRIVTDGTGRASTSVRIEVEDAAFTSLSNQKIPSRRVTSFSGEPQVPQGSSVMIAGQTTEQSFEKRKKTPILGDIPVAGELFKRGSYGGSRVERLFLITPRLLSNGFEGQPTIVRAPVSFEDMDRARSGKRDRG